MSASMRKEALRLLEFGFAIFPLYERETDGTCGCGRPTCKDVAKHPVTKHGLRDATQSILMVERWYRTRRWNIGIATGSPAVVLDIDPRHDGDKTIVELEKKNGTLPGTWRAFTGGGGEHVYFAPPDGRTVSNSVGKLGAGLDVRGHGGYVVAPPSVHKSGREYAWNVNGHPKQVPLAPMPKWLIEACASPGNEGARFDPGSLIGATIAEGGRNAKLASLTGHLLRRYVDPRLVFELVSAFNDARCRPPLTPAEVTKIVESIAGRELRRRRAIA